MGIRKMLEGNLQHGEKETVMCSMEDKWEYVEWDNLSERQWDYLKRQYIDELCEEGVMGEVVFDRPDWDDDPNFPENETYAIACEMVPESVIEDHWGHGGSIEVPTDEVLSDVMESISSLLEDETKDAVDVKETNINNHEMDKDDEQEKETVKE